MSLVSHHEKSPQPCRRAAAPTQRAADRARAGLSPRYGLAQDSPRHGFAPVSPRHGLGETPRASGLPAPLKANVEALSGMAMDDVQVHRNSPKAATLDAFAFTQGSEIHLGPGQEHHLPHEAWHVVQQKQGRVTPTLQLKGAALNDDSGLEAEADRMGARAASASVGAAAPELSVTGPLGRVVQRAALSASRCTVTTGNDFRNNHLATSTQDAKTASVARARSLGQQTMINTVINSSDDDFRTTIAASEFNNWANGDGGRRYQELSLDHWEVRVARGGNNNYAAGTTTQSTGAVPLGAYFNYWRTRRNRGYRVVVSKVGSG